MLDDLVAGLQPSDGRKESTVTDAAWEALSNQAVAAAGVVYFLAMLAHLVEHAAAPREVAEPAQPVAAASRRRSVVVAGADRTTPYGAGRMFGRLGLLLTVLAAARAPAVARRARPRGRPEPGAVGQHVRVHARRAPSSSPPLYLVLLRRVLAGVDGADRRRRRAHAADGRR